jgi:hypothetical protein
MFYQIPVYFPDGTYEYVYLSQEFYDEEKLYNGTNLEKYIIDFIYFGQFVNVGYPQLVDEKELV